jgi:thiol-disulfide isomerase/thioredoxin
VVGFVVLLALAAAAVVVAFRTDPESIAGRVDPSDLPVLADSVPGPELAAGWLNGEPATLEDRVVVYDFWTYSCVNCLRTLPHLRAWYERYRDDGLVIVGVHSPEFEFERDEGNVADAVEELDVTWPVALDPDMEVWDAFGNRYWPAKYVVDRAGRLRYHHIGEGAYEETEDVLRSLLGVDPSSPRADDPDEEPSTAPDQSPETYLGSLRGGGGAVTLEGEWDVQPEYAEALASGAAIVLPYRGTEVNLVISPGRLRVTIDGGEAREVEADDFELVNLVTDGPAGDHELRVEVLTPGLQAYAFTFGSG